MTVDGTTALTPGLGALSRMKRTNLVRSDEFAALLADAVRRYENRTVTDAEIVSVLVSLAKDLRAEEERPAAKGLSAAEMAFYDAVIKNESALELGDETLKKIARELVVAIRGSATLDWRDRQSVKSELKIKVKALLKRNRYPPDGQESAIVLVLEQATVFTEKMLGAA